MRIIQYDGKQFAVKSETEHYYLVQQAGTEPMFSINVAGKCYVGYNPNETFYGGCYKTKS